MAFLPRLLAKNSHTRHFLPYATPDSQPDVLVFSSFPLGDLQEQVARVKVLAKTAKAAWVVPLPHKDGPAPARGDALQQLNVLHGIWAVRGVCSS